MKLRRAIALLGGRVEIHRDLGRTEEWSHLEHEALQQSQGQGPDTALGQSQKSIGTVGCMEGELALQRRAARMVPPAHLDASPCSEGQLKQLRIFSQEWSRI